MATELTEWRPFSDFAEIRHRLDQAFRDLSNAPGGWSPSVDVVKHNGDLVLRADLPVSGEHREEKEGMPKEEAKQTVEVKTKTESD